MLVQFHEVGAREPGQRDVAMVMGCTQVGVKHPPRREVQHLRDGGRGLGRSLRERSVDQRGAGGSGQCGRVGFDSVPRARCREAVGGRPVCRQCGFGDAGRMLGVGLDQTGIDTQTGHAIPRAPAARIRTQAADNGCLQAQSRGVQCHVQGGATKEFAIRQNVPERFSDTEDATRRHHRSPESASRSVYRRPAPTARTQSSRTAHSTVAADGQPAGSAYR